MMSEEQIEIGKNRRRDRQRRDRFPVDSDRPVERHALYDPRDGESGERVA
jgi:hypothetical protein